MKTNNTSWGQSAEWYSSYLENTEDSYQKQVILPNLLRVLNLSNKDKVLDIACGQGFFSREFAKTRALVSGVDISSELIREAKRLSPKEIAYGVSKANDLKSINNESFDTATIILAIQNIEDMNGTFAEASRILKKGGRLVLVIMHPAFRIPEGSSWGYDEKEEIQYRRVDRYLSLAKTELLVHPGKENSPVTISYHRSLQDFSKSLFKNKFAITRLEEWISHKKSQKGPRSKAEDRSRSEFPLFMMIEATKI